jgi:hypothetical protein
MWGIDIVTIGNIIQQWIGDRVDNEQIKVNISSNYFIMLRKVTDRP